MSEESPGPSTDRHNDPVVDPTKNVLGLVAAETKRQDDLRIAESEHVREIIHLRADVAAIRVAHARELREAEALRIDAIRAVDVAAVQQAATVAETRATALANTVAASAEAMRSQVAAAAGAAATSLAAALVPIQERLAELTRLQYEQQGQKAQVVEGRAEKSDRHAGWSVGAQLAAVGLAFFSLILLTVGTVVSVYIATH